jgi:hypothetical protein
MTLHSLDHFHEFSRHRGAESEYPGTEESLRGSALPLLLLLGPVVAAGAISAISLLG